LLHTQEAILITQLEIIILIRGILILTQAKLAQITIAIIPQVNIIKGHRAIMRLGRK